MNKFYRITGILSLLVIALMVMQRGSKSSASVTQPAHLLPYDNATQQPQSRVHVKRGPEVAKRVRDLRKYDKNVDRALAAFENNETRNGHRPRIDDAQSLTIDSVKPIALGRTNESVPFRQVSFRPQYEDYSGYGLELLMIPTYQAPGEWQGTLVLNKFDPSGAYIGQYVTDVIFNPTYDQTEIDVNLEVSFEDGQAYLEYGNATQFYNLGDPGDGGNIHPLITANSHVNFQKATFKTQWNPFRLGQRIGGANPRIRGYVRCTWVGSGGAGFGCGVLGLVSGGTLLPDCLLVGAATANGTCALAAIFGG